MRWSGGQDMMRVKPSWWDIKEMGFKEHGRSVVFPEKGYLRRGSFMRTIKKTNSECLLYLGIVPSFTFEAIHFNHETTARSRFIICIRLNNGPKLT